MQNIAYGDQPNEAAGEKQAEKQVAVIVRLPKSLDRAIEMKAAERDVPKRRVIEEALRAYLDSTSTTETAA